MDEGLDERFGFLNMGWMPLLALLIAILAPVWLLSIRVRGCFVPRIYRLDRDLALLFAGPLVSILVSISRLSAALLTVIYFPGEIHLALASHHTEILSYVGFLSFVVGLVAFLLPQKSAAHLPPTKTQPEGPS